MWADFGVCDAVAHLDGDLEGVLMCGAAVCVAVVCRGQCVCGMPE